MAKLPKLLTTRHLLSDDVGKAAEEAFRNAQRLVQAGQLGAAHKVLAAMFAPGPWRTSKKSDWRYHLLWNLWWLEQRLGVAPVLDAAAEAAEAHAKDVRAQLRQAVPAAPIGTDFFDQLLAGRSGEAKAKSWSPGELAQLVAGVQPERYGPKWSTFRGEVEVELRRRVRDAALGKGVDPGNHGALVDAIERGEAIAYPRDVAQAANTAATCAAVLDVHAGHPEAAAALLGRVWPKVAPDWIVEEWNLPAFADFLASGALGNALGIDAAGAQAYLDAMATRTPEAIAAANKPKPWKQVLKAWLARKKEDGLDAQSLLYGVEQGLPACKPLVARAKKGHALNTPAKEADVAALEARIGQALPPSYREFLLTTDGLVVPDFLSVLPARQVAWLHELEPDTIAAWNESHEAEDEATDEQYATYGAEQDCIHMRPAHLKQALMISQSCDGDVLLLVPAVRFDDEWEAWSLGAKNPGAYRYKSFRALMEQKVLADE
jgi:hypothetical protein